MHTKVVTFGEIMLRLSTPGFQRILQASSFDATYGGSEANVAVSLAQFGLRSYFVTRIPANPVGQAAVAHLRRYGVDTSLIASGGQRLGIYFLETGASQRPSLVIYDRVNSAIANAKPEDFDWARIFDGVDWFHFTGITPAISDEVAAATLEACRQAKALGVTVSCDLNYRKKLWSQEKANKIMSGLMEHVDLVVANEEDAEKVFGIKAAVSDVTRGFLDQEGYRSVAFQLLKEFSLKYVAITLRESYSASDNGWSGLFYDGEKFYHSRKYKISIVDRVGCGDSFAAGIIYALLQGWGGQNAVEFAAAASCLKHTVTGDFHVVTLEEVLNLVGGDASGRVQR